MKRSKMMILLALGLVLATILTGCTFPYTVTSSPGMVVFELPLNDSISKQQNSGNFSVELLNKNMVSTQQITVQYDEVKNGQNVVTGLKPNKVVILVDTSNLSKLWTNKADTGSGKAKEGFEIRTKDNITLDITVACDGNVARDNAASYVSNFIKSAWEPLVINGWKDFNTGVFKYDNLSGILDRQVHDSVAATLPSIFAAYNYEEISVNLVTINKTLTENIQKEYSAKGINISKIAIAEYPIINADTKAALEEKVKNILKTAAAVEAGKAREKEAEGIKTAAAAAGVTSTEWMQYETFGAMARNDKKDMIIIDGNKATITLPPKQ